MLSSIEIFLFFILLFFIILIMYHFVSFFIKKKEGYATFGGSTITPTYTNSLTPSTNPFHFYSLLQKNNIDVSGVYYNYKKRLSKAITNQDKIDILNQMIDNFSFYTSSITNENTLPKCILNTYAPVKPMITRAPEPTTPAPTTLPINNAIVFDGTFYLSIPDDNGICLPLNQNEFTVEAWIYPDDNTTTAYSWGNLHIPSMIGDISPSLKAVWWSFGPLNDGRLGFYTYVRNSIPFNLISFNKIPKNNQYVHVALVGDGSQLYLYMDGKLQESFVEKISRTDSKTITNIASYTPNNDTVNQICIGYNTISDNGEAKFMGSIESIKISTVALYTSSTYTPPPLQLISDNNTILLVGTTGTQIIETGKGNLDVISLPIPNSTPTPTPKIVYLTQAPYTCSPNNSIYFDGTFHLSWSDVCLPSNQKTFTIEAWINVSSFEHFWFPWAVYMPIFIGGSGWFFGPNSDGKLTYFIYTNTKSLSENGNISFNIVSQDSISINKWVHIAVSTDGTYFYLFIDGKKQTYTVNSAWNGGERVTGGTKYPPDIIPENNYFDRNPTANSNGIIITGKGVDGHKYEETGYGRVFNNDNNYYVFKGYVQSIRISNKNLYSVKDFSPPLEITADNNTTLLIKKDKTGIIVDKSKFNYNINSYRQQHQPWT
jgi:hypothetical protein